MVRYRRIACCMWGDGKFRQLSPLLPSGQALWLYLLTNDDTTNVPGIYKAGRAAMAERLRWSQDDFDRCWQEIEGLGLAKADWDSCLVVIPNVIKYDPPQAPNVVKSWNTAWQELPECALKTEHFERLQAWVEGFGEAFRDAFRQAMGKGFDNGIGKALAKPSVIPDPDPDPETRKKKRSPLPTITVDQITRDQEHHARTFDKDVDRELKAAIPTGDLRRRIAEAYQVFGQQGCLDAHWGHKKECERNQSRGKAYRLCYPVQTQEGKPQYGRLERSRFAEMVAVGRQRRETQQRSERRTKRYDKERSAQEKKAAKEAPFDPSKLPPGIKQAYEKARAGQTAKEGKHIQKKKPHDVPDGLPGSSKKKP